MPKLKNHYSFSFRTLTALVLGILIECISFVANSFRDEIWGGKYEHDLWWLSVFILFPLGVLLIMPWPIGGLIGGVKYSIKKLRGWGWTWVVVLLTGLIIPLGLYLIYLVFMALLGEVAYCLGQNTPPVRQKCPECRAWIPYEAKRCQHCGQAIAPVAQ